HIHFPLPLVDLTDLPEAEREPALARMGADEVDRPINLATGPVLRGHLYKLDTDEHVLLLVMHHVVTDGWSMGVMLRELRALYAAFLDGRPSPLAPLAVQYADYAAWQHGFLRGETLERQLGYWKDKLAGAPTVLELPSDRPRPAVQRYRGSHLTQFLEPELARRLEALARREGSTLYMVLLAAFYTLLYRYTGQKDLLVGTPVANRMRPEVEELVGFFVNTLVLRTDLSGDPSFRELVARVRETALGAYAHQDVPFERLVEELGVPRDMSHEPLFQVMFVLQNAAMGDVDLPGVTVRQRPMDRRTTKFDFTVFMWADADGLRGWWEYNTDLWDRETVDRLLGHYHTLLRALAADPDARIETLPLLTAPERTQVLEAWNDTAAPEPEAACVHHLVEAQVRRTPDAVAVVYEGQRLTYAELNARANQLAHHLIALGVGPDRRVGICVERSLEMVVALLAILKAGGAVVAIDPTYPEERIAFMVRDAGLAALLTQQSLAAAMPSTETQVVLLDRGAAQFAHHSAEDPAVPVGALNLMYCIYTSGSTGIPKGVGVPHREFLNLLQWQWNGSGLARQARTVQFATFGFCVSFQECFGTWAAGSTLVVIPESRRRDLEALMEVLRQERVERLYVPFAALKHLSEISWDEDRLAKSLREVVTAGEPLQVTQAMRVFFRRLGAVLHNQYGSSETHVVTALPLEGDPDGWPVRAPVGRPIANARIYLLDAHLQPVPVGVPGEVCVGGEACLPRGYLGDPALTAAKLVPDPFSPVPGARMYRSGDVARQHRDGTVEVTGRLDFQIKVRGFRVEIGEVEAAIRRIAAVRDVAVVAGDNRFGEKRLIAYPVFRDGPVPAHALVDELKRRLPEYMIPTAWVAVDRLPVNANGKLDAAALPAPEEADAEGAEAYVAPRTATEAALAEIWSEVLAKGGIGVRDNFFAVGGHSLLATQVMARVRDRCRADLPLRALFDNPTVETLARAVDGAARTEAPAEERVARRSRVARVVHIAPVPGEEAVALPPAAGEPLAVGDD
ncbi:MAG TPA: amino acid adenylation domain-containing protein, partial [Longimicrobium sp.]|nr:amino acid adenylation domain-containing protein [Longimicrobium sp.]